MSENEESNAPQEAEAENRELTEQEQEQISGGDIKGESADERFKEF